MNPTSNYDILSLQSWVFSRCCEKKQVPCENQCGRGNEGGGVQFDSTVREAVQCSTSAHIPLITVVI